MQAPSRPWTPGSTPGLFPLAGLSLGLLLLSGCVTATIPTGPDTSQLKAFPDKPKIAIADFKDDRTSEKAGTIGAASLTVKRVDLETVVTSHTLDCLNRQLDLNVEKVAAAKPEDAKQIAASSGAKYVLLGRITKLNIHSADAILEPVKSELEAEVSLYDAAGKEVFHSPVTGKYSEYFGLSTSSKTIGKLVDATARSLAHEVGIRFHDEAVLKNLN